MTENSIARSTEQERKQEQHQQQLTEKLVACIYRDDLPGMQALCENSHENVDLQKVDRYGRSLLHIASWKGRADIVAFLLSSARTQQQQPQETNSEEKQIGGRVRFVEQECRINKRHRRCPTALLKACRKGHLAVVKCLIDEGECNIEHGNEYGENALHMACQYGHVDIVEYLIDYAGLDALEENHSLEIERNSSPMFYAFRWGHLSVVRFLLEEYPAVDDSRIRQMAMVALDYHHFHIVRWMVTEQNDLWGILESVDSYGTTLLYTACRSRLGHQGRTHQTLNSYSADLLDQGLAPVVQCLLELGACPNGNNTDHDHMPHIWKRPICEACDNGVWRVVKLLVKHGADYESASAEFDPSKRSVTPLQIAVQRGSMEVIRYLVEDLHVDVDTPCVTMNIAGRTALHMAVRTEYSSDTRTNLQRLMTIIRYLVEEAKANIYAQDAQGMTPLHLACHRRDQDCSHPAMEYLLEQDKQQHAKGLCNHSQQLLLLSTDQQGRTPLYLICQSFYGRKEALQWTLDYAQRYDSSGSFLRRLLSVRDKSQGNTVLHMAIQRGPYGHYEMVALLLQYGANLLATNNLGQTCIELLENLPPCTRRIVWEHYWTRLSSLVAMLNTDLSWFTDARCRARKCSN